MQSSTQKICVVFAWLNSHCTICYSICIIAGTAASVKRGLPEAVLTISLRVFNGDIWYTDFHMGGRIMKKRIHVPWPGGVEEADAPVYPGTNLIYTLRTLSSRFHCTLSQSSPVCCCAPGQDRGYQLCGYAVSNGCVPHGGADGWIPVQYPLCGVGRIQRGLHILLSPIGTSASPWRAFR